MLSFSQHIGTCSISVLYIWLCFLYLCILTSAVFWFCTFDLLWSSLRINICSIWILYFTFFPRLCILTSAIFQFFMFYIAFLVCAYRHLQYFSSVYFTLLSLSLHVGICNVSVLYILLYFPSWCILASAIFQFCIFYFGFLVSAYWYLQYFSSVDFSLLSSSLHIVSWSIWVLYTLPWFSRLCILTSAVFQFCIFYFDFLVSGYWCLHYFGSVCFTLLSPSLHIGIHSISVLYFTLLASFLHNDRCSISFLYFTLLSSSLHIDICSISIMYFLLCFLHLCIFASAVFQFRIFYFAFLVSAYWHLQSFSCVYLTLSTYKEKRFYRKGVHNFRGSRRNFLSCFAW